MCVLIAGATEYVKFFISVLMLCDIVCSYVVSLSEVIRAEAVTSLLNNENKLELSWGSVQAETVRLQIQV